MSYQVQIIFSRKEINSRNGKTKFMSSFVHSLVKEGSISAYYLVTQCCKIPKLTVWGQRWVSAVKCLLGISKDWYLLPRTKQTKSKSNVWWERKECCHGGLSAHLNHVGMAITILLQKSPFPSAHHSGFLCIS